MRLIALTLLAAGIAGLRHINHFDGCDLVGHDAHWISPTVRACTRCPMTWRRDTGEIGATTTNQPNGW